MPLAPYVVTLPTRLSLPEAGRLRAIVSSLQEADRTPVMSRAGCRNEPCGSVRCGLCRLRGRPLRACFRKDRFTANCRHDRTMKPTQSDGVRSARATEASAA
jgi:hypothetical protein